MAYNPKIHHRRSIRLKGYDYSQAGAYFITICCEHRICRFGKIENNEMILNELGNIAYNEWAKLAERFANFELDVFQIMPNHMHGIIVLKNMVGAGFTPAQNEGMVLGQSQVLGQPQGIAPTGIAPTGSAPTGIAPTGIAPTGIAPTTVSTVGDIVGAYKSLVFNGCLEIYKSKNERMGKLWQRNYWERVIRNDIELGALREYIVNNPLQWHLDKLNP